MKAIFVRSVVVAVGLQVSAMAQAVWTQVGQGAAPPNRSLHAMAYDITRQRVVMFGGLGGPNSQTWEWDGSIWTQLAPASAPSDRYGHSMAFDAARQRTVLFGGSAGSLTFSDTWEWDGVTWLQRSPPTSPSGRYLHTLAYDSARQRIVMFGGRTNSAVLAETWEWDGSNWNLLVPASSPPGRYSHSMAYDSVRQRTVVFGGSTDTAIFADTWEWNGTIWSAAFTPIFPGARFQSSLAYDAARQRIVLFGGRTFASQGFDDTWEFSGSNWAILTPGLTTPFARAGHAMAYDVAGQRIVLCGGSGATFPAMLDTWINGPVPVVASATPFGAGCGQPPLGVVPDAAGRPILGLTASATIVDAPTSATFVAIGSSNQTYGPFALPVTLAGIGMVGCDLYQSAEVLGLATSPASPTTRSFSLAIPNTQTLIGLHVYLQAYAFAPGANPLSVTISNAIDWRLGDV